MLDTRLMLSETSVLFLGHSICRLSDPAIPTLTLNSKPEIRLDLCKLFSISITAKRPHFVKVKESLIKKIVGLERIRGFNNIICFSIHF